MLFKIIQHLQILYIGWGTVIRTQECRSQSPMPYRLAIPQYVLKYTTYNVLCKPFAQALVYYITLETKKQVFFLEYSAS